MKLIISIFAVLFSLQTYASVTIDHGSYGKMGRSKAVFGVYLRDQILEATEFPHRMIGQLTVGCTGTLIGPKHVITAAHCVYDTEKSEWIDTLDFMPARTSKENVPHGVVKWTKVYVQQEYLDTGDTDYDFAVVELETAIGDEIGWSGYQVLEESEYESEVQITGYPGDKDLGTMWTVRCPTKGSGKRIYYMCDTYGGMSGSGIFSIGEDPLIKSIHTFGSESTNGGVAINRENFDLIYAWKNLMSYPGNTLVHPRPEATDDDERKFDRIHIKNNCHLPVRAYLNHRDLSGDWVADGPWTIQPGQTVYVANTKNRTFYFAALTNRAEYVWKGTEAVHMKNGDILYMIETTITTDTWGDWTQALNCN